MDFRWLKLAVGIGFAAGVLSSCDDEGASIVEREVVEISDICAKIGDGGELDVEVIFNDCMSSSCDSFVESSCTITETASGVLQVTGRAVIEREHTDCSLDCQSVTARCALQDPQAQSYTITAGEQTLEFDGSPMCADTRV